MKHGNISIFVPHNGCPHQCSFCNQKSITGVRSQPSPQDVKNAVQTALSSSKKYDYEIAFFGGSFTAIDRNYMVSLLEPAYEYVKNGSVSGIRLSTRPDAIDDNVLKILKKYGVTAIELGTQSLDDEVLLANKRGHTAEDVEKSSVLIKKYGFSLGLQMMTGLYKSTYQKDIETAEKIIALAPDTVRIYPTVTIKNTMLADLLQKGEFVPCSLDESVELCAVLLQKFAQNNIEVIRLGLHYSEELEKDMLSANYHPAFRELCENKIMLNKFFEIAQNLNLKNGDVVKVSVSPSCVSKFVGQKRANILKIAEKGISVEKVTADKSLSPMEIKVKRKN